MKTAAEEAIQINDGGGGGNNIAVAYDDTWQKRGHTSKKNYMAKVTSLDSGKQQKNTTVIRTTKALAKKMGEGGGGCMPQLLYGTSLRKIGMSAIQNFLAMVIQRYTRGYWRNPHEKKEIKKKKLNVWAMYRRNGGKKKQLSDNKKRYTAGSVTNYWSTSEILWHSNYKQYKQSLSVALMFTKFPQMRSQSTTYVPQTLTHGANIERLKYLLNFYSLEPSIPEAVMEVMKYIYRDLANTESLSNLKPLQWGVNDAVITMVVLEEPKCSRNLTSVQDPMQHAAELSTKDARVYERKRILKEN
ncbi:hypothetical protein PR048_032241 [Dryococelus australis]|uniref:Uncharacterized protein n=1 Tax=Dryococelus australis TaxID=614101 RepID=A0ABQ9G4W1_9NEOP|nr:hypothetical protein PR048_032241 [Dryococelus australis]